MAGRTRSTHAHARPTPRSWAAWATVFAVLVIVTSIRLRIAGVPLERDEGEYAYAGQLILRGIPPYQLAYNMKLPGAYLAYAAFLGLFGGGIHAIRIGLIAFNATGIVLLFLLARRAFGGFAAALAACGYALLSLDLGVLGPFAHATQIQVPLVLASALVTVRPGPRARWNDLVAGLLVGLAILVKQQAALLVPFGPLLIGALVRSRGGSWREALGRTALHAAGVALPFALTCAVLAACGVFPAFWFWTVRYAGAYASEVPISRSLHAFHESLGKVTALTWPLWLLAGAGACAGVASRALRARTLLVLAYAFFALLAISPGFYFREHYYVILVPAVALLAALALESLRRGLATRRGEALAGGVAGSIFACAWLGVLAAEAPVLLQTPAEGFVRAVYGDNPFPEARVVADTIAAHTRPDDRIAVLGSEPEIYFYSRRASATGHIYMYGLVEPQPFGHVMTVQAIREIEASRPPWIVVVNVYGSWLFKPGSDSTIVAWTHRYLAGGYRLEGIADIAADGPTVYTWGPPASRFVPRSQAFLLVCQRKDLPPLP